MAQIKQLISEELEEKYREFEKEFSYHIKPTHAVLGYESLDLLKSEVGTYFKKDVENLDKVRGLRILIMRENPMFVGWAYIK